MRAALLLYRFLENPMSRQWFVASLNWILAQNCNVTKMACRVFELTLRARTQCHEKENCCVLYVGSRRRKCHVTKMGVVVLLYRTLEQNPMCRTWFVVSLYWILLQNGNVTKLVCRIVVLILKENPNVTKMVCCVLYFGSPRRNGMSRKWVSLCFSIGF